MLEMLMQWYRRRFSDPVSDCLAGYFSCRIWHYLFLSGLLAPLLVAIVLAYLLEWPTVRLQSIGCSAAGRRRLYWWFLSVYCY